MLMLRARRFTVYARGASWSRWRLLATHDAPAGPPAGSASAGAGCSAPAVPPGAAAAGPLPLAVPLFAVWGANTNVGKTLLSVGLAHAAAAERAPFAYLKPLQTGFPADSDARLVALACGGRTEMGPHAAAAAAAAAAGAAPSASQPPSASPRCTTLFAWRHAVSPHLAVLLEGRAASDDEVVAATAAHVRQVVGELLQQQQRQGQRQGQQQQGQQRQGQQQAPGGQEGRRGGGGGGGHGEAAACSAQGPVVLVETAGGVTSPAPSGRLAVDVLRPLRLPALLVGDPRLGGIAATLSAADSLVLRGLDVEAVVLVGGAQAPAVAQSGEAVHLDNAAFLAAHFASPATGLHRAATGASPPLVVTLPHCPPPPPGHDPRLHGLDPGLAAWLAASLPACAQLLARLRERHAARLAALAADAGDAARLLWWPFTQHASLGRRAGTLVDSRCGEAWAALVEAPPPGAAAGAAGAEQGHQQGQQQDGQGGVVVAAAAPPPAPLPYLAPLYDASGSWWTQAATAALQPELARAVGGAAGRYLHLLFAEVAHAPALAAARALLGGPGAGWAARVFFSDDGSTAIEVALKMAFRKFLADRGELAGGDGAGASAGGGGGGGGELRVLGLQGAYHGDTLGAADCVAPSPFNAPLQAPWYRGRGLFLEPPYVGMAQGAWRVLDPPAWLTARHPGPLPTWPSLDAALAADDPGLAAAYASYIHDTIADFEAAAAAAAGGGVAAGAGGGAGGARAPGGAGEGRAVKAARLAACVMEPLVQGAGGMLVVEPGFQRAMAKACRARRLPLILDEVFTGLYRAGWVSAAAALRIVPDIAAYGKLLTGGAAPLAATLASADVFAAFEGPSKLFALLHGHSYTAYPVGAATAAASLRMLSDPATNPNLCTPAPGGGGGGGGSCTADPPCAAPCGRLRPLWDAAAVADLSHHPLVSRVAAVGTLLAVDLRPTGGGGGYGASGANRVVRLLRSRHGVYARPLGNTVYVMVPPTAAVSTAVWLAGRLRAALDEAAAEAAGGAAGVEEEGTVV